MKQKTLPRAAWIAAGITAMALMVSFLPGMAASQQPGDNRAAEKTAPSKEAMPGVKILQEKRVVTVTGTEDWDALTGFGKDSAMAEMMTLMMVGGSGMEHMKMGPMKPGMTSGYMTMGGAAMVQASGLPLTATVTPNPPVVGDNMLDIAVTDSSGKPVTGLKLLATVGMTNMDMGTARPTAQEGPDGHYRMPVTFSMKGPWRVALTGAPGDKKSSAVRANLDFNVGGKDKWVVPTVQPSGPKVTLVTPADAVKVGKNMLEFAVQDEAGKPVAGAKVTSAVGMTSMDMGTAHPPAKEGKDGHYTTQVEFSMKGPWRVTLVITPPNQKPFARSLDFDVKK